LLGFIERLIQVSEILAQTSEEVDRQVDLYAKIAEITEQRLGDSARAFEQFALENLDRISLGLEQWSELAGILEQRAATADGHGAGHISEIRLSVAAE
jgi:hypothetical protein